MFLTVLGELHDVKIVVDNRVHLEHITYDFLHLLSLKLSKIIYLSELITFENVLTKSKICYKLIETIIYQKSDKPRSTTNIYFD